MKRTLDKDVLCQWIGRTQEVNDVLAPGSAQRMAATLGLSETLDLSETFCAGSELPYLWHWLYFLQAASRSELGQDGHAALGLFLPPVDLARRMWAGGEFRFHKPIRIGQNLKRLSKIKDISLKQGKSGQLCFTTVGHDIFAGDELCLEEEQYIVYLEHSRFSKGKSPSACLPETPVLSETFCADAVLLFRYSALTFNGHRIHYDQEYARDVEGYPGLVVHGPLIATLLANLAHKTLKASGLLKKFRYRAYAPLFDGEVMALLSEYHETGCRVLAHLQGKLIMEAFAE